MLLVITNHKPRPIESINFEGLSDVHFLVITDDKFEHYWNELKVKCNEQFVNPHIHFLIPNIKTPIDINNFALAFGVMLGCKNPRLHNND